MPHFFCVDPAAPEISSPSLPPPPLPLDHPADAEPPLLGHHRRSEQSGVDSVEPRSEEHTTELQPRLQLVCRTFFVLIRRPRRSPVLPSRRPPFLSTIPRRRSLPSSAITAEASRAVSTR